MASHERNGTHERNARQIKKGDGRGHPPVRVEHDGRPLAFRHAGAFPALRFDYSE